MPVAREQPVVLVLCGCLAHRLHVDARGLKAHREAPLLLVLTCQSQAIAMLVVHGHGVSVVARHGGEGCAELPVILCE